MDGIIDIIIAILFIAIPTIFKAIGNKLEKAGKSDKAGKFKKIADSFSDDEGESTVEGWILEQMNQEEEKPLENAAEHPAANPEPVLEPVFTVPEAVVQQMKVTKRPEHLKPANRKPVMLIEDEPKKREKIDPKKLVIYSEIMTPKF